MSEVNIRRYQPGDEGDIIELLDEAFDGWVKADLECSKLEHWRWKYLDTPSKTSLITVAVAGDEIIGVDSQYILPLQIGDKVTLGSYSGDLAVKREYRGQGISNDLVRKTRSDRILLGVKYTYFVTQNPYLVKSYDKRYHIFPVPIINMVRIGDLDLQLGQMPMGHPWLIKTGYRALQLANKVKRLRKPETAEGFEVKKVTRFPSSINQVIQNNGESRFLVNNGERYLNWRYCDPRAGKHEIMIAEENGACLGYIVTRINRFIKNYPIAYIMDLLTNPNRTGVAWALLESALKNLDSKGVNIVTCMVPKGHPYERVYNGSGFINSMKNLHLYTNLNELNQEHLLRNIKPHEAHFCYGSIDSLPTSIPRA